MADERKYTVIFKRAPDYRIYPCQLVFGGVVPDKSGIMMNICVDHPATPNYISHPIGPDGMTVDARTVSDIATIGNAEREMLCGIFVSPQQAAALATWLMEKVRETQGGTV
jgi:hypothetical protein